MQRKEPTESAPEGAGAQKTVRADSKGAGARTSGRDADADERAPGATTAAPESPAPAALAADLALRPLRNSLIVGLAALAVVTASLLGLERYRAVQQVVEQAGQANAELARAFANGITAEQWAFIARGATLRPQQLRADPAVAALRTEALRQMRGLSVAKFKIYSAEGVAVFSTNEHEIGEQKAGHEGFMRARAGETVSGRTLRDRFDAPGRVLYERELIDTMVPVPAPAGGARAVVELHSDATALLQERRQAVWPPVVLVFVLMAAALALLAAIARQADAGLRRLQAARTVQERTARRAVFEDVLTGLPNRLGFVERLAEVVARAKGRGRPAALMSIGLEHFKAVNHSLGLTAGDKVLVEMAHRLGVSLRDGDQAFRMGDAEFAATLPGVLTPEDAARVAQRIQQAVAQPVQIGDKEALLGVSIGIAFYPRDGKEAETLLRKAQEAMDAARVRGGGVHAFAASASAAPQPVGDAA